MGIKQKIKHAFKVVLQLPMLIQQRGGLIQVASKGLRTIRVEGLKGIKRRLLFADLVTRYSEWIQIYDALDAVERDRIQRQIEAFNRRPKLSIVMPVFDPPPEFLEAAIASVRHQLYEHWELCIADDASHNLNIREIIKRHTIEDQRIKAVYRQENGHISKASNSALELVTGEFVFLLDHDDLLPEQALFHMAETIVSNPEVDIIYSDEDKIDEKGQRVFPFFKPDWSPHLATAQAYLGHLVGIRTSLLKAIGGWRSETNGAQDYDLWLRASLQARQIVHIPKILYHWRIHAVSTAQSGQSKPYAHEAGRQVVQHYVDSRYPDQGIKVHGREDLFTYSLEHQLPADLMVSIIIPTRDRVDLLKPCIESICQKSSWQNFEIIVIDNGSKDPATLDYLAEQSHHNPQIRILRADIPFNWSHLNNLGAQVAQGDIYIFLNNDTQVIAPDWLQHLAGYARLPDVGLVGALLLFEDETIQHSGVVIGMGGWADHVFRAQEPVHTFYAPFISPVLTRNVLAVTGACMAVTKEKFELLGGFDEAFMICGSDAELGVRAYQKGLLNVLCAEAKLFHLESKTRTAYIPESDFAQSAQKYAPYRVDKIDPFFNPNLSLYSTEPTFKNV